MKTVKISILIFVTFGFLGVGNLAALPAPAYLSNPYFLTCKAKCAVIDYGTWQQLDMDCINACISLHEDARAFSKDIHHDFSSLDQYLDRHIDRF
jgi:hypothetical protein